MSSGPRRPFWYPPESYKAAADWAKILAYAAGFAFLVSPWFVAERYGHHFAIVVAAALLVLTVAFGFISETMGVVEEAVAMLKQTEYKKVAERQPVIDSLGRFQRYSTWVMFFMLLVTLASLTFALGPLAYNYLRRHAPEQVAFETLKYYRPGLDVDLIGDDSFLEAVIGSLRSEGAAEGKSFRIAVGTTIPFPHPTPDFKCRMDVKGAKFLVSGYAFRRHREDGRNVYQEVQRSFPENQQVIFDVPAEEDGDQLFLLVRLTLLEGAEFPENLKDVSSLQVIK
jgi:hypothetical protein